MSDVLRILRRIGPPQTTLIWSGAGVSVDPPSNIPAGLGLTRRAIENAFEGVDSKKIQRIFSVARMPGRFPRFETVLGVVADIHQSEGLEWLLSDLAKIRPNRYHAFFAAHILNEGRHLTANVDPAIETVFRDARQGFPSDSVIHFHGIVSPDLDLTTLGITLTRIESGFNESMKEKIDEVLVAGTIQTILVLGYSGLDYFDVTPYLQQLAHDHLLEGKLVIWMDYDPDARTLVVDETHAQTSALETIALMRSAGAEVHVLRGKSYDFVELLMKQWAIVNLVSTLLSRLSDRDATPAWPASVSPIRAHRKKLATIELYSRLGLPGLVLEIEANRIRLNASRLEAKAFAEAAWQAGRYQVSRRWWNVALQGDQMRTARTVRAAACEWVSGRYIRSAFRLRSEIHRLHVLDQNGLPTSLESRADLSDIAARFWAEVRVIPGVRWLASSRFRVEIEEMMPSPTELDCANFPDDVIRRIADARLKIKVSLRKGERLTQLREASEQHSQTSSIVRTLNYRQGIVREVANSEGLNRIDFYRLHRGWQELGALGEAARLTTILGALPALGCKRTMALVWERSLDYRLFHRIRLSAAIFTINCAPQLLARFHRARSSAKFHCRRLLDIAQYWCSSTST